MILRAFLPFVLLVWSISACLPIPHAHRRSPSIRGRMLDAGAPVSGVTIKRVLTTRREDCGLYGDVVLTDDHGSFQFERRYEFRAVVPLYGDPVDPMVLCIYRDGELVGAAKSTLMGGAPREMELVCDLELLRVRGQEAFCGPAYWVEQMRGQIHGQSNS